MDGQKKGELTWGWNTFSIGPDDDTFKIHVSVGHLVPFWEAYWGFDYIKWECWDD